MAQFFFVLLWTETKLSKKWKKEHDQYPAVMTEQTWLTENLL